MRLYDLVLICKTTLSDKDREKLLDTVKGWLKDVKIVNEESWGQKPLAYKIKKQFSGHYQRLQMEAKSIPADFEKRLLNNEDVLRHLLLRTK